MALTRQEIFILLKQARPLNLFFALGIYFSTTYILQYPNLIFIHNWKWYLEGIIVILIMISGYWINDIFDVNTDYINKPQKNLINRFISLKKAFSVYFSCIFLVLILTIFVKNKLFFLIHILTIFLLFWYSFYFQKVLFVGNVIISGLGGLLVFLPSFLGYGWHWIQFWLASMAFWITFLREIIKDILDVKGDIQERYYTLPIRIGIRKTKRFLYFGYFIFFILWLLPFFMISKKGRLVYGIESGFTVVVPMVWSLWKLASHYHPNHFSVHSNILKWIALGGVISGILLRVYQ